MKKIISVLLILLLLVALAVPVLAVSGSVSVAPISAMVSKRESISAGELACPVERDPECPVFIAVSISIQAPSRTSPTIILSGLIRREVRISSLIVI